MVLHIEIILASNGLTLNLYSQETGPHLFEFSPSGVTYEYFAMAIGARSQSAKTYLERHFEEFADCKYWAASIFHRAWHSTVILMLFHSFP